MLSKTEIRQYINQQREQIDLQERLAKSDQIFRHLTQQTLLQNAHHIASYLAYQNEVDTQTLIQHLWQQSKHCYLPAIGPDRADFNMRFARYQPTSVMEKNRYGIAQPVLDKSNAIAAEDLDVVLVPLVAFDKAGNRLGMGAGFYDRAFAFKKCRIKPLLIGVAYDLQEVNSLPRAEWDVALDGIVTESGLYI